MKVGFEVEEPMQASFVQDSQCAGNGQAESLCLNPGAAVVNQECGGPLKSMVNGNEFPNVQTSLRGQLLCGVAHLEPCGWMIDPPPDLQGSALTGHLPTHFAGEKHFIEENGKNVCSTKTNEEVEGAGIGDDHACRLISRSCLIEARW